MVGKDTFFINKKYLKNSNYSLSLGSDIFAASFQERLIIGPVSLDDTGDALFTKKAVVVPSQTYFDFINSVRRAKQDFEKGNQEPWEMLIYKYSKVHHVVAKFEQWEENDPTFRI